MFEFLFDIVPEKSHLRITIRLVDLLKEKKQAVCYTETSGSPLLSAQFHKEINNVVHFTDFQWLAPDVTLLDCQLAAKASFYRQRNMDYIWVGMAMPGAPIIVDPNVFTLYLPPAPNDIYISSPRTKNLVDRLTLLHQGLLPKTIIIGLLEEEKSRTFNQQQFYEVIKKCSIENSKYHFILLTNHSQAEKQHLLLPSNMEFVRALNPAQLLPLCDLALTTGSLNAWIDCTYAHLPVWDLSESEIKGMTPEKLKKNLTDVLQNREKLKENIKELNNYFDEENRKLNETADRLIEMIKQRKR